MSWMRMYPSGIRFDLLRPQPEQVRLDDIAHSLSRLCRFAGHVESFYCVAQHCLLMDQLEPQIGLHCLLHDAAETYLSDVPAPVKGLFPAFQEVERNILEVIYAALGVAQPTADEAAAVHRSDLRIRATEAVQLCDAGALSSWPDLEGIQPYRIRIQPEPPGAVQTAYRNRLDGYLKGTI